MGSERLGTWGAVGTQPPPSNWGSLNIGEVSNRREIFTVGVGLPQPRHGDLLWSCIGHGGAELTQQHPPFSTSIRVH